MPGAKTTGLKLTECQTDVCQTDKHESSGGRMSGYNGSGDVRWTSLSECLESCTSINTMAFYYMKGNNKCIVPFYTRGKV